MTSRVFFTSDLHFGHAMVAGLRGFASVEEHDTTLCERWKSVVRAEDQVWVLGDVALGSLTIALETLKLLPGEKHLVAGNHDKCHGMYRNSHKWLPKYLEAFATVQMFARRRILSQSVLLSHLPYSLDRGLEPRYVQYRLRDEGVPLLHGHTHSKERVSADGREIHVGVDAWDLTPVSLDTVAILLDSQTQVKVDSIA